MKEIKHEITVIGAASYGQSFGVHLLENKVLLVNVEHVKEETVVQNETPFLKEEKNYIIQNIPRFDTPFIEHKKKSYLNEPWYAKFDKKKKKRKY